MTRRNVDLFTMPERVVLIAWFAREKAKRFGLRNLAYAQNRAHVDPAGFAVEAALATMGVTTEPGAGYSRLGAAVGSLLLRSVQHRLPQWESAAHHGDPVAGRVPRGRRQRGRPLSFTAAPLHDLSLIHI